MPLIPEQGEEKGEGEAIEGDRKRGKGGKEESNGEVEREKR